MRTMPHEEYVAMFEERFKGSFLLQYAAVIEKSFQHSKHFTEALENINPKKENCKIKRSQGKTQKETHSKPIRKDLYS